MLTHHPLQPCARVLAVAGLCLAVTACGPTASMPTPAAAPTAADPPATATTAPTASAPAKPATAPTAVARPTQAQAPAAQAVAAQPTAPAQTASMSAAIGDAVKLVLDSSASQASYRAREQLVGRNLPSEAVGTSRGVSGTLVLAPDGTFLADQSNITVDLRRLQSNESRRDNFIRGDTLQTNRFPMATFVPRQLEGLSLPLPASGQSTFQLIGDLTVHGVTRPVTWQVTAQFDGGSVTGTATTNVKITDFGMTPPRAGPVLSIEDALTLELAFTAAREA
jgi:polyisoprenoid-binding protein YceI